MFHVKQLLSGYNEEDVPGDLFRHIFIGIGADNRCAETSKSFGCRFNFFGIGFAFI